MVYTSWTARRPVRTTDVTLVNTVDDNRSNYTNRDYSCAVLACQLQKIIGRPSTCTFTKIVENNLLPNCPVMQIDIMMAVLMWDH